MEITLNGEKTTVAQDATVLLLIESMGLKPQAMVVERNNEMVDREHFASTVLQAGDTLELVHIVGGG
jgi:sulfur carrier protein